VLRRTLAGVAPQPRFAILPAGPADQVAGSITAALADFAAATGAARLVLKTIRGGYDGKGVWVLPVPAPADVLDAVLRSPVRVPGERAGTRTAAEVGLLVEEFVPFVQELAAQVARSPSGQAAAYPVVATRQRDGVCAEVIAPAPVPEPVALAAQRIALDLAGRLGVVGLLAVELFQTDDGAVLVNELAMRPHNSGHWTIDGAVTSQFEQHLRAVLDLPLGATTTRDRWTVMANVLGGAGPTARDLHGGLPHVMAHDPGARVHLYGKSVAPGRKVGHVTVGGADLTTSWPARGTPRGGWPGNDPPDPQAGRRSGAA
jgi:5-(carboxyamino)imidazole ribonucleotide synthase